MVPWCAPLSLICVYVSMSANKMNIRIAFASIVKSNFHSNRRPNNAKFHTKYKIEKFSPILSCSSRWRCSARSSAAHRITLMFAQAKEVEINCNCHIKIPKEEKAEEAEARVKWHAIDGKMVRKVQIYHQSSTR